MSDCGTIKLLLKYFGALNMAKTQQNHLAPLTPSPKALDKALKESADRRKRLAAAFGIKVPGYKLVRTKKVKLAYISLYIS